MAMFDQKPKYEALIKQEMKTLFYWYMRDTSSFLYVAFWNLKRRKTLYCIKQDQISLLSLFINLLVVLRSLLTLIFKALDAETMEVNHLVPTRIE